MDRTTERRVLELKRWRSERARETCLDPGVLCPNATLETIPTLRPSSRDELAAIPGVKVWFGRNFGSEVLSTLAMEASHS